MAVQRLWISALSCLLFVTTGAYPASAEIIDQKVTNEIDITSTLILPSNKMQRGDTLFELVMSDSHYERARGTCAGLRSAGQTAFKIVGADEEWEKSLSSQQVASNPNGGILGLASDGNYYGQFVNPGGSPVKIGGISTWVYAYTYGKKMALKFKTNGWKGGEYTIIGFLSDGCRDYTMVTKKFTLPEIPKASLKCESVSNVYLGDIFEIACTSNIELSVNGVVAEIKTNQGWVEQASAVAAGKSFTIEKLKTDSVGVQEFRVRLIGIQDQIQDSVSDSIYIQSNPPKLTLKPNLIITKQSKDKDAVIRMEIGNSSLAATLQSSKFPNGPWVNIGEISSDVSKQSNLPFGTWVRVKYEGNSAVNAGVSDPYQILITPKVNCFMPSKVESGKKFSVTCKSNQSLQSTPVSLQYLDSKGNWVSVSKGTATGTNPKFTFNLKGAGSQKLRIRSEGLKDFYTAFSSNSMSTKFNQPTNTNSGNGNLGSSGIPKGKADKESNAYKYMYNFGRNLAANSLASDSAQSQCLSAKNSGLVKVRGIPQYLGVQATQIQSYLATASGFQGCLDGFGK